MTLRPTTKCLMENMRQHEGHEAPWALYGKNLFCGGSRLTKQIAAGAFRQNCLILPHNPHELASCLTSKCKNMRIMRVHEGRLFNGFYLPCIGMGVRPPQKYEANMRQHEGHPHVLVARNGGLA